MKPHTAALATYLSENDDVVLADLYTFALIGGQILRIVDYPLPSLTIPAANFPGSPLNYAASGNVIFTRGVRFGRSKVTTKIGIEPAELDIDVYAAGTSNVAEAVDMIGSLTWQQYALAGGFDGATCELDRLFLPAQGSSLGAGDGIAGPLNTSLGAIVWFYGRTADIDIERSVLKIKVKSEINLLQQQQMPRRLFQTGCTHIFGDAMCLYDRVGGKNGAGTPTGVGAITVTAIAGSTTTNILVASSTASYYTLGTCLCLSGQNAGISRGIISNAIPTNIGLSRQFPFPVAVGDTFQLLPGCDHTSGTCQNVFNNLLFYGGFDYVPPPEFAL